MTDSALGPVVAIDIDGVLRLRHEPVIVDLWPGVFAAEFTVRRGSFPTAHHGQPDWDANGEVTFVNAFSGVGAAWIRDLLDRGIEVDWASTWGLHANKHFPQILGIPPLPAATLGPARPGETTVQWKMTQLVEQFPGRPLLWVDDDVPGPRQDMLADLRAPRDRALTRTHWIGTPTVGITLDDVAEMDEWLALASTHEGQRQLRADRRRELARVAARRRRSRQRLERDRRERALRLRQAKAESPIRRPGDTRPSTRGDQGDR
ncbi:hypothetical protein [Microbacterium sp. CJ88]|uniref:hypothetical protein n=1 Tax=Microbacterium sp. CJ88 TaxID=3445672 RepID=UPI003F654E4E